MIKNPLNLNKKSNKKDTKTLSSNPMKKENSLRTSSYLTDADRYILNYLSLHIQLNDTSTDLNIDTLIQKIANQSSKLNSQTKLDEHYRKKRSLNGDLFLNQYDELLPASYPRKKDWRDHNVISGVDNQGK